MVIPARGSSIPAYHGSVMTHYDWYWWVAMEKVVYVAGRDKMAFSEQFTVLCHVCV